MDITLQDAAPASWIGLADPTDSYRGLAETKAYTLAFFDRYLKGKPAPLSDETPDRRPDVRLEERRVSPSD
ncbi:hypothetical protein EJ066_08835 [Mesorhizobium sp. M9A.F.Ca.ET.002.03.1.2]|uniref:hypothetical protein n=1 Tax=Mesorhizobium sp. M9A.F.Ca.ET.002.03.1.2 TaxID=2493668 RepID=UPI000F7559E7|nr:hypothetical protein [Mesorhizobium sp. M9A.F.Ca.ET.002.03.1.2]AZN97384.1 hypothetical protein EJ066_08835 [Mesorhizobium sp. M9A.F.Ca.ET.002.03.1.2]